jgi:hypothetical protein
LISRLFNHVAEAGRIGRRWRDSKADFFGAEHLPSCDVGAGGNVTLGDLPMSYGALVSTLSVVTAYIALAIVGAIVIGVI